MKKTIVILLLLGVVSFSATAVLNVVVNVQSVYEINVDRYTMEVPSVRPGQFLSDIPDNEGIKVNVKTNNGEPWQLKIHDTMELTDGNNTIPNSNFYWYGHLGADAKGVWYGKDAQAFTLDPVLAYSSGFDEDNNFPDGTDLYFKFRLNVPKTQNSGKYRSIVAFTLTE
ncbi:MAG: hypothetical protein PHF25_00740 [Candidatus Margulisbacteria bacterium]|nr:hypothetical protein [Candidatus Margulisiibacteriota bacterium]